MLRGVLSLVVGVVASGMTVAVGEAMVSRWFPPPSGLDVSTPEGAAKAIAAAPAAALWLVILGYAIGAALGGYLATRIAHAGNLLPAIAVGAILTLSGVSNLVAFSYPIWMALATMVVFLPAAIAGGRLAGS